jgi:hypothetical protein
MFIVDFSNLFAKYITIENRGNPLYRYPEWIGFKFFSGRAFIVVCRRNWGTRAGKASEPITSVLKASTLYDLHQYHHDCDDQENVNESTHGVGRDQAKQPKDNQDNRNSSEHFAPPQ